MIFKNNGKKNEHGGQIETKYFNYQLVSTRQTG